MEQLEGPLRLLRPESGAASTREMEIAPTLDTQCEELQSFVSTIDCSRDLIGIDFCYIKKSGDLGERAKSQQI
jgi:hypothetical protein